MLWDFLSCRVQKNLIIAAGLGIEPRFTASKAAVLPLDDPARLPGNSKDAEKVTLLLA